MPEETWMLMRSTVLQGDIVASWFSYQTKRDTPVLYRSREDALADRLPGEFPMRVVITGDNWRFGSRCCTLDQLRQEAGRDD